MFRLGTLLVGGLIGAGIAMLTAPRTGVETKEQLRTRVRGLQDQYGDVIEQGRIRATELVQSSRDVIEQTQSKVTTALERSRTASSADQTASNTDEQAEAQQPPQQQL